MDDECLEEVKLNGKGRARLPVDSTIVNTAPDRGLAVSQVHPSPEVKLLCKTRELTAVSSRYVPNKTDSLCESKALYRRSPEVQSEECQKSLASNHQLYCFQHQQMQPQAPNL